MSRIRQARRGRDLTAMLKRMGWTVVEGGSHLRAYPPGGEGDQFVGFSRGDMKGGTVLVIERRVRKLGRGTT